MSKRAQPPEAPRRDLRPWIYAACDVLAVAIYVSVARVARSSSGTFESLSVIAAVLAGAAGLATLLRRPWSWWVAVLGCGLLIAFAVFLILSLIASAAFLRGVYGSLGRSAAAICLVMAALAVELYGLIPAFQLRYLLSADGRRAARRA